jgi:hypothetical protein
LPASLLRSPDEVRKQWKIIFAGSCFRIQPASRKTRWASACDRQIDNQTIDDQTIDCQMIDDQTIDDHKIGS